MINYSHNNYFYTFCETPFIIEILSHNSAKDQLSVQMFDCLSYNSDKEQLSTQLFVCLSV